VLATLLDRSEGEPRPLVSRLTRRYGGELRFPTRRPWVFANFVQSLDGVVSLAVPGKAHASVISARNPDDRFLLGLLRVVADAVVVGAGTLRQEPNSLWTPDQPVPDIRADFAAARERMRLPPVPLTVLVTKSGELDLSLPVFNAGHRVLVLTTTEGAKRVGKSPRHVDVRVMVSGASSEIVEIAAAESGGGMILTEGGPTLFGEFVRERTVDELFLTIAPRVAGRDDERRRLALVEKAAFPADELREARLVSVKAADDYLFTRFATH